MRGSSTTPSILTWFESVIVTPEMFTETWLDNDWARWLVAKGWHWTYRHLVSYCWHRIRLAVIPNRILEQRHVWPSYLETRQRRVVSTLADSYVAVATRESGLVAKQAAERKSVKYIDLQQNHIFQPIAVENLGALSISSMDFWSRLAVAFHLCLVKKENRHFFFSAFLSTFKRFNSVLLHVADDIPVM